MCMAAIGLIGAVVQGIGAVAQGNAQADAEVRQHNMNAEAQTRQAAINQTTAAYQAQRKRDEVERNLGAARAAAAGSGLALDGSVMDVIGESAVEGEMDIQAIRWNGGMEADTNRQNAAVSRSNAQFADSNRPTALTFLSPVLGGVARFGSSFG